MKQSQWSYSTISILLLVVSLIAFNVVGSFISIRLDVTDDRLYTISEGTETVLEDLQDPATIKLYYSSGNEALPPEFKSYAQRVEDLLEEYAALANGKIKLEIFDPEPDTEAEEWAEKYGISRVGLPSGESFYLGMVVLLLDREVTIPFFDIRREKLLEYDISQALLAASTLQATKIGILTSAKMRGAPGMPPQQNGDWVFLSELEKNFDVQMLETSVAEIPEDITVLLLIHPKALSETTQYAVDQYVLRGGRLIVMVDPNLNHEMRTTPQPQFGAPPNAKSDLQKLLTHWGVNYNAGQMVGDFQYATSINSGQGQIIRYPVWMSLTPQSLDGEHPITSQLETLLFVESGYFTPVKESSTEFLPLIETSPDSGIVETFLAQMTPPEQIVRDLKTDQTTKVLAAFLRGRFTTAFPQGQPPLVPKEGEPQSVPLKHEHLTESKEVNTLLVVADVDFVSDSFAVQKINFLGQTMINPLNDNLNLLLNAVEFLSGNDALMSIRSRGRFSRPFTRIIALENKAQLQFQEEEVALQKKLQEVQEQLKELEEQKSPTQNPILTTEQQEAIKKFRTDEINTRKRLRAVRKILRQDIERLENWLLGLNMLLIPALVAVIGIVSYRKRLGRRRK